MERFAWQITLGGLALVAGLWIVRLFETTAAPGLFGVALVLAGIVGLGAGIASEIEV